MPTDTCGMPWRWTVGWAPGRLPAVGFAQATHVSSPAGGLPAGLGRPTLRADCREVPQGAPRHTHALTVPQGQPHTCVVPFPDVMQALSDRGFDLPIVRRSSSKKGKKKKKSEASISDGTEEAPTPAAAATMPLRPASGKSLSQGIPLTAAGGSLVPPAVSALPGGTPSACLSTACSDSGRLSSSLQQEGQCVFSPASSCWADSDASPHAPSCTWCR